MTTSTQIRKNEFIDMLDISEQEFTDEGNFVHCNISTIGKCTYYPKADKLNIHLKNNWELNGFEFVKNVLNARKKLSTKEFDLTIIADDKSKLRDQFAMAAMNGYLSASVDLIGHGMNIDAKNIAEQVYLIADAMMKQREL